MATLKVKFRPSAVTGKKGTIYYQVIHKRVIRQIKTDYQVWAEQWDEKRTRLDIRMDANADQVGQLNAMQEQIDWDIRRVNVIIQQLNNRQKEYTADDVVVAFHTQADEQGWFGFMQCVIVQFVRMGKHRTAETYMAALKSFSAFREHVDVLPDEIDADLIRLYEAYLYSRGVMKNTVSFYMRILRAVYNRAVEKGLTVQRNPFRRVYTGVDRTVKRAVSLTVIRRIKELDLSDHPSLDLARDLFLFSFYTRGMAFVDMAYLKKVDLQNGLLAYRRHKTGQQITVKWEKCMQAIIRKHSVLHTPYLLPLIKVPGVVEDERRQYRNALHLMNERLKTVAAMAGLDIKLSMYVARHSWASIARSQHIPIAVISEGMGHDSEATTQIYLASLDTSAVDRANEIILGKI